MAEAPSSTSPTLPKNAVSVTATIFCARRLKIIGYEIFQILWYDGKVCNSNYFSCKSIKNKLHGGIWDRCKKISGKSVAFQKHCSIKALSSPDLILLRCMAGIWVEGQSSKIYKKWLFNFLQQHQIPEFVNCEKTYQLVCYLLVGFLSDKDCDDCKTIRNFHCKM